MIFSFPFSGGGDDVPLQGGGVHVPNSTLVKHDDVFEGFGPRSLGTGWCSPMARAQHGTSAGGVFFFLFGRGC